LSDPNAGDGFDAVNLLPARNVFWNGDEGFALSSLLPDAPRGNGLNRSSTFSLPNSAADGLINNSVTATRLVGLRAVALLRATNGLSFLYVLRTGRYRRLCLVNSMRLPLLMVGTDRAFLL
jgi:hypothetical protein